MAQKPFTLVPLKIFYKLLKCLVISENITFIIILFCDTSIPTQHLNNYFLMIYLNFKNYIKSETRKYNFYRWAVQPSKCVILIIPYLYCINQRDCGKVIYLIPIECHDDK